MPRDADPAGFNDLLEQLLTMFGGMVVARAPTKRGTIPVLGVLMLDMADFLWAGGTVFMPWATPRNILEGQVAVVDSVRREGHMLFTSKPADKAFWTQVARYGVIGRVGTIVDGAEPLSLWETRKPR